jgi:hypothetical protein
MADLKTILKQTIKDLIVDGIIMFMGSTPHSRDDPKFINLANLLIQDEVDKEYVDETTGMFYGIKIIYYRFYARLYNIFQQHIGKTDNCYNNMDASMVFPVLFNVDYYKCIPESFKGTLGECQDFLKDVLGTNKFNNLIDLIYAIENVDKDKSKNKDQGPGSPLPPGKCSALPGGYRDKLGNSVCDKFDEYDYYDCLETQGCYWKEDTIAEPPAKIKGKEHFNTNKLTTYGKYQKCLKQPICPSGNDCPPRPIEVLSLKFLTVVKDFDNEFNEKSTRNLFENKNNTKLKSHIEFIDEITENIANEMIGKNGLVCNNYLSKSKEGFVGNFQGNQSNKIMKAVLFALLFYILSSKQVQSILRKILKNVYKTYKTEHLLIVSMIVFAIFYYVINLFI